MEQLRDRVAVVTGGGSGIGASMALAFAAEGMNVAVADIEEDAAERVAAQVRDAGVRGIAVRTDVADVESVRALAERAYDEFGAVHLLCNNAGVLLYRPLIEMSPEDWQWLLSVNVQGVANGLHAFLPRMLAQGGEAHIVNTGSMAGLQVSDTTGIGGYTATKFAVVGMSEALRGELAPHGIGVSVLCPGGVNTQIRDASRNRHERFGASEDVVRPGGTASSSASSSSASSSSASPSGPRVTAGAPGRVRMEPQEIAELVVRGVRENRLYIITHPQRRSSVVARTDALLAAFDAAAEEQGVSAT